MISSRVSASILVLLALACSEERERNGGGRLKNPSGNADAEMTQPNGNDDASTSPNPSDPDAGTNPNPNPNPTEDAGRPPLPGLDAAAPGEDASSNPNPNPTDAGTPPNGRAIGANCAGDNDCASNDCISGLQPWWESAFAGGYCSAAACSTQSPCPAGSDCFIIDDQNNTTCLKTCMTAGDCGRAGYECFEPGACLPEIMSMPPPGGGSTVGGPCMADTDCTDTGASCVPEVGANGPTGWPGGYCVVFNCSSTMPCPSGSECFTVAQDGTTACLRSCTGPGTCGRSDYACLDSAGACIAACTPTSCDTGEVCDSGTGLCVSAPCTAMSCAAPLVCDAASGQCIVDVGTPPPGPVPSCSAAPAWNCTGGESYCGQVVAFEPDTGPGYWDYPINGESSSDEYRSYIRRDVMMMVKYAAYMVDCLSAGWSFGNQEPLGLGDMSESNGAIPGTSDGQPGHPAGTHVNGRDMDIAYYQLTSPDNQLRPVCDHIAGGQDQYHCVAPPDELDVWRTALFLGYLHQSPQLRVIGVDGQVGPLVDSAMSQLCANNWLNTGACSSSSYAITYETTDMGRGWFAFHHHHFHISFTDQNGNATVPNYSGADACLRPDCRPVQHDHLHDRPVLRLGDPKPLPEGTIFLPRN